jgi:uncharacterized membrane protein YgcG
MLTKAGATVKKGNSSKRQQQQKANATAQDNTSAPAPPSSSAVADADAQAPAPVGGLVDFAAWAALQTERLAPLGIALQTRPDRGRCLVANKPFRRGELVLQTTAAAQCVHRMVSDRRCANCFATAEAAAADAGAAAGAPASSASAGKLSRCTRCKVARYCGRTCQLAHWKRGHKQLCSVEVALDKAGRAVADHLKAEVAALMQCLHVLWAEAQSSSDAARAGAEEGTKRPSRDGGGGSGGGSGGSGGSGGGGGGDGGCGGGGRDGVDGGGSGGSARSAGGAGAASDAHLAGSRPPRGLPQLVPTLAGDLACMHRGDDSDSQLPQCKAMVDFAVEIGVRCWVGGQQLLDGVPAHTQRKRA